MSDAACEGQGTGWGTIAGSSLRLLLAGAPDKSALVEATHAAFSMGHQPLSLSGRPGFFPSLTAAKAAEQHRPHLVHAFGASGLASASMAAAAGLSVPWLLTLDHADIQAEPMPRRAIESASALILTSGAAAEALRRAGVTRELYVIAEPHNADERAAYRGALEIVYGRALGAVGTDLSDAQVQAQVQAQDQALVQLGGLRRAKER